MTSHQLATEFRKAGKVWFDLALKLAPTPSKQKSVLQRKELACLDYVPTIKNKHIKEKEENIYICIYIYL